MSFLDSIPSTWNQNFKQRSKGDPRGFINHDTTKSALWASQDVYNSNTHTSFGDWTQVASRPFQPAGSGRIVAAMGGGDLRLKVYKNSKNEIMVAFVGTKNLTGVWQDAQLFKPIRADFVVPDAQGELHSGFAAVYQAAKPEIQKILNQYPNAHVTFTGHSLGGAVASIASADQWPGHQVNAITVGAPQIGNEKFSKWYQSSGARQDRIIQKADPITIGNLGYVHADESAWVIGNDDKWVSFDAHGIAQYRAASEQVNGQLHSDSEDLIYKEANAFVSVVGLAQDAKKAYEYYKAAEEFYEFTQVASGLPLTTETFRNVVLTQEGVLARGFETTLDKLTQFQTPSRQDFHNIFVDRIGEVKEEIAAGISTANLAYKGINKFVDVTDLNVSGLADIAPDILRPVSNVDVLSDLSRTANADLFATEGTTILTPLQGALDDASRTASNYFKLITESDTLSAARQALTSTSNTLSETARPVTSAITNVYASTEGVRNWVSKTLPKAASVGGFLLSALSLGTGIADIAHGDTSAETIAGTTFAGIGTAVAGVEAAVAFGALSSSVLTTSLGAGLTIPVIGQIAAVGGLLTFGIAYLVNKSKQKSTAQLQDEAIYDTLAHIGDQAISAGIDIGIGSAPDGGDAFYHLHKDQVHFTKDGKLEMIGGGPLIDLVYPAIQLADGSKIHADDPQAYQQGVTAQEAYKKLQEAGIATGTSIQFVSDNYKDFRYQTVSEKIGTEAKSVAASIAEAGKKAIGQASNLPLEAPDVSILFQGKPFQDHFLPTMTYKGQTILPSENPKLYAQVQIATSIYDNLYKFDLGDKDTFINTYATQFQDNNGQIQIDGQDFKDAIFQPIEGISYSQNPGAYEHIALAKYLYDGLTDKGLSTGGLSESEFLGNYFAHIDLDQQGNIKIDGIDAADYHYDPIADLNGQVFFRFQDPDAYDKVQAFYSIYDKLNDQYKDITGRLLGPRDLWNELSPTMQLLSGNQVAFGMTPDEMMHPQNQLYLLHQTEQRALDLGIPIDQKKLSMLYKTVETASFNNTNGNGFSLSPTGDILVNGSPLLNNIAATYFFNGRTFDYTQSPKEYINGLQYKDQEKYNVGAIPKSLIDVIMQNTIASAQLPSNNLSSYTGYLTKAIGPVDYTPPESQVLQHELGQLEEAPRKSYAEYQADLEKQTQAIRDQRAQDFANSSTPMEKPEPTLRASDKIYEQLVLMGIPMQLDKNQFSQLYAPHITFDQNGAILINGKPSIPLPQPIEYNGQQIYQVSDPQLYTQVQAAETVFAELSSRGQLSSKDKTQFIDQYKGQLSVSETGDITFQGKTIGGQVQNQPSLSFNNDDHLKNAVIDRQPPSTLPNPFETNPVRPTPHAGVQPNQDDVPLPTQFPEQQSLMNPLQNTESKIEGINTPLAISEAPNATAGVTNTSPDVQAFYSGQDITVPGSIGFVPNGQKLNASLQNHLWVIHFENGEQDTYPRQRELQGYCMMGNWTGSTPLANGGPVNVLDSYMLAFHIQRKHKTLLATKFLRQRLDKAIQMKTISINKDLREFEITQQILAMNEGEEVFSVEAVDRESSWNIGARLQTKMQEVMDQRNTPAALPLQVDLSKVLNIPKMGPADNPLKRSIEAAGILGDSMVQSKLRRVYSEYQSYMNFGKAYMQHIDQAQGGTIVPNMKRTLLEGIIAKDQIVEDITNEWMFLLNQPVAWLFQNV